MANQDEALRVILAADGFCPQAFWWQGRMHRILALEGVRTLGAERHYQVGTVDGCFELGLDTASARWRMRRTPGWLSQMRARWYYGPRYPLPFWRRRSMRPAPAVVESRTQPGPRLVVGEIYANRPALVR